VILRPAVMADVQALCRWRNDPTTRAMSRRTQELPASEHIADLVHPLRKILIAEVNNQPVGTTRTDVDLADRCVELSWTVAPEHRRRGIGLQLARELVAIVAKHNVPIRAEVKHENLASHKICKALGMTITRTDESLVHYHLTRPGSHD
jgi:RimJ/RimL family protein N-acetyltransferase